mmetsp:Transcript_7909/g.12665  ORF Transcript_7909/g.12665 Transcript_7909/m.12665 type:complete len:263 (-) Transcript_7909:143-931(-)
MVLLEEFHFLHNDCGDSKYFLAIHSDCDPQNVNNTFQGMQIVAMMVGHFFFDGALSKTNQLGGPSPLTLRYMGAKYTPLIRDDFEYWRLVTPIFLHANIMHLAMNLFFLSQVGYTFELRWGSWQIALLFLLSGISGDMFSAIGNPGVDSVGASGCLFGLLGADIVYMYINWDFIPKPLAQCEMCIICGLLLLNAMSGGSSNTIDNYAHFGGFVGGAVASFSLVKLLRPEEEPRKDLYRKGGLIGTLAIWISFFLALYLFPAE